ncbi:matrixin family metalloprotease [Hymenobacter sp. 15J16-1T3B]|uniref:matrixin family metalloprotease n=1 Tax=Hymenobacter sp. 15J16-1T3B TaxID=2886941 RepID=UPI001D12850A|nr:matrixin family metalloprotease [Hymenobacter sp. 15J16-1T3B]MCC3160089.1 matrixin family metalloprotease [Hymenobacter sp. 15J16-1T3B]
MTRRPLLVALFWAFTFLTAPGARAQETCLLVPASLKQRTAKAALVVEARVSGQQAVADAQGNIFTLHQLDVYKVFQGQLPASGLRLAERGGTLGLRREEVTGTAALAVGQQGLFFLEPDPVGPERQAYRLVAGPQGFVRYDAPTGTAAEPFARYRSIEDELYPAVERSTGQARRTLKANPALLAVPASTAARTTAPIIGSFLPASLSAGTGSVLTIVGTGFGTLGSASKVEFPNADQGGQSYVAANSTDYVLWTDTQIQVRVPSRTGSGGAGSGTFRVTTADGLTVSSPAALAVVYSYSNVASGSAAPARPRLVNDDNLGGYTLQYAGEFAANADAKAAFERALATWQPVTRLNLRIGAAASSSVVASDGINIVRFDTGGELPSYVLGQTTSRYSGCITGGVTYWTVAETDYNFSPAYSWNFTTAAPTSSQFDFESVALHEQGHAQQLGHIIRPGAVMHYAIGNGQQARTLSLDSDVAGVQAVIDFSLTSPNPCGAALIQLLPATVLPVELLSFAGRYEPALPGTRLSWATATEQRSAYFAVQATVSPTDAASWQEVARTAAAGQSTGRRDYQATDPRPLAAGQTRYYRLRQVDTDGTEQFSDAVSVSGSGAALAELQAYPNPASEVLHVQVPPTDNAAAGQLTLLDAAGRLVQELRPAAATAAFEVPVSQLRNGVYLLQWHAGNGPVLRRRIMVQH